MQQLLAYIGSCWSHGREVSVSLCCKYDFFFISTPVYTEVTLFVTVLIMVLISLPFCNACFALSIATTWRISPAFQSDLQVWISGSFFKVSDVWFPLALFGVGRTLYSHFVKSHAFLVLTFMLLFYTSDAESTLWTILFMNTHKDQHYLPLTWGCLSFFGNILAWPCRLHILKFGTKTQQELFCILLNWFFWMDNLQFNISWVWECISSWGDTVLRI